MGGFIMKCISSVSYSANVNGTNGTIFRPPRHFHQGYPLSPFLFLVCSERLSALMRLPTDERMIKGAKTSRKGSQVSHLLFVDDCILFEEVTEGGAQILKSILKEYEICIGQCVNFIKSTIFFSLNTSKENMGIVSRSLGMRYSQNPKKYLGLPNVVGRRKKALFQTLKVRVKMRIKG